MDKTQNKIPPLALLLSCLLFAGCGDGWNPARVRAAVAADHPGAEIQALPRTDYKYLVRQPDGTVLYVEYLGNDLRSTASAVMFNAR